MTFLRWIKSTFTLRRWLSQPFMLCGVGLLQQASIWQLVLGNSQTVMTSGELAPRSVVFLSIANLVGSTIVFYGLHLRDWEQSLSLELSGYLSMIWPLLLWVALVYLDVPLPNTSYGLNLTEGFVIASGIRIVLILRYRWAWWRGDIEAYRKLHRTLGD
jgi:hypothetical protein